MNSRKLGDMMYGFVELDPSPRYDGRTVRHNVWRVAGYDSVSGHQRILLDHIGGGIRYPLFFDRVKKYDAASLGYPSFKQGRLVLTVQIDFTDGKPARESVIR